MARIALLALGALCAAAKDCTVYSTGDGKCGESTLNCLYVTPAKAFNKALKDGTCAEQGYTEATGETQTQSTPVGDIIITFYVKPSELKAQKDCTVYSTGDGKCGESTLNCLYVTPAKAFNKALKDGTCAEQGYTEATGETQKQSTGVGDIIITFYVKPSEWKAQKDCTVYSTGDGKCGESTLNCLYVTPAKAFNKALKDGTCAEQGYTQATGETQKQSTPVGDIIITFYVKPSELKAQKDCTVYSTGDGKCGESTLNCLYVTPAKAFNKALKDGTCAEQGYTEATGETQKQSTPVGDITITFYVKPSELEAQKDCTVYSTGDGKCGESTLNCLYVAPAKAFNKALKDGTCAEQGYTEATGETQKQSTPVGDIIITFYIQPSLFEINV